MATRIRRGFPVVFSSALPVSRDFYVALLGWRVDFDSDWFVHLQAPDAEAVELGILRRDHGLVPEPFQQAPAGAMITVVVEDVDGVFDRAESLGVPIVEPPQDQFYGQRRMLVTDPDGTLLDISSECPPSEAFLASLRT